MTWKKVTDHPRPLPALVSTEMDRGTDCAWCSVTNAEGGSPEIADECRPSRPTRAIVGGAAGRRVAWKLARREGLLQSAPRRRCRCGGWDLLLLLLL